MDNQLIFLAVNWFRFTESAISIIFVALTYVVDLIFVQLGDIAKELMMENTEDGFSDTLDEWKSHFAMACQLVERIKDVFGFIMLIQLGHFITEMTHWSANVMFRVKTGFYFFAVLPGGSVETYSSFSIILASYSSVFLRLLIICLSSCHLQNQVWLNYIHIISIKMERLIPHQQR